MSCLRSSFRDLSWLLWMCERIRWASQRTLISLSRRSKTYVLRPKSKHINILRLLIKFRMAPRRKRRSYTSLRRSKRRRQRRLVSSTCFGTSSTQQRPLFQRECKSSYPLSAVFNRVSSKFGTTSAPWRMANYQSTTKSSTTSKTP